MRWGFFVIVFAFTFVIAISRLYLGAHWLSDVLGGFLIGISWTALVGIAYLKGPAEIIPRRLLGLVAVLVILTSGGWHVSRNYEKDLVFYAPQNDVQSIPEEKWLDDGWRELPAWRIDMAGEREQPLTIQWAGSLEDLSGYLFSKEWHLPPVLNLRNFLRMFSREIPIEELPVLPRLHDGRIDSLRLFHQTKDQRWVLRLWPADVNVTENKVPIFVGTIEEQRRSHLSGLIFAARDTGEYDRSLNLLRDVLHDRFAVKSVSRTSNWIQNNSENPLLYWMGSVLLVWEEAEL
jgi:undecaprenyl-diphosphatase